MRRHRHHIIAISAIVSIVVIMFWTTGALERQNMPAGMVQDGRFLGDRFIQISRADWGAACNKAIDRHNDAIEEKKKSFIPGDELPPKLSPIPPNNALLPLSRHCDGKAFCGLQKVNEESLGIPIPKLNCEKKLEISYRCFEFDRPHDIVINRGKELRIDCRDHDDGGNS